MKQSIAYTWYHVEEPLGDRVDINGWPNPNCPIIHTTTDNVDKATRAIQSNRWYFAAASLLLVGVAVVAYYGSILVQDGRALLYNDFETAVEVELLFDQSQPLGSAEVQTVKFYGDYAIADVKITTDKVNGAADEFQTAIFAKTKNGWDLVAPDMVTNSRSIILQAEHLTFLLQALDQEWVEPHVVDLDRQFIEIMALWNIEPPKAGASELTLSIDPKKLPDGWQVRGHDLFLTSPWLIPRSVGVTLDQELKRLAAYPMTQYALNQYVRSRGVDPQWQVVINSLRKWSQLCYSSLDSQNCRDIFQHDISTGTALYAELLLATNTLPMNFIMSKADGVPYTHQVTNQQEAAHTLIAFIHREFGVEGLQRLIQGIAQEGRWETLITSQYNISPDEFSQRWLAYLSGGPQSRRLENQRMS